MKHYKPQIIGFGIGAACGLAYWYFVGCASGTCPITSSPIISTLWGGVTGLLIGMSSKKERSKK